MTVGTTNDSMLRSVKMRFPLAIHAASATLTPLVSVTPAVKKYRTADCHSGMRVPCSKCLPVT